MHDPDFDQVLLPGEFDEPILDKFVVVSTVSDDTFHVTVVDRAADTGPSIKPTDNNPTTSATATIRLIQQTLPTC